MTIEALIKKLKTEKQNGTYYILLNWHEDLKKLHEEYKAEEAVDRRLSLDEHMRVIHREMSGFVWGLYAAEYISDTERSELLDELLTISTLRNKGTENGQ